MTDTIKLPLPEPRTLSRGDEDGSLQLGYSADQMRAYAQACADAAVAQERERCAKLCVEWACVRKPEHGGWALMNVAAAIRVGEPS